MYTIKYVKADGYIGIVCKKFKQIFSSNGLSIDYKVDENETYHFYSNNRISENDRHYMEQILNGLIGIFQF